MPQGIICLDIDGTLTHQTHDLHPKVLLLLTQIHQAGWKLVFITGRTFSWGHRTLSPLNFPFYLAVMNGAIIVEMPACKIVTRRYLNHEVIPAMEQICANEPTDFVIYGGMENQDLCYYRANKFSPEQLLYLKQRAHALEETWVEVASFEQLHLQEFPSVKCFGSWETTSKIVEKIEEILGLHVPLIKDPFNANNYVAQATHPLVNKGHALSDIKLLLGIEGPIIAAGDDNNDKSMLAQADIKIVMANAPADMLKNAEVIAPPATEHGIIQGLREALKLSESLITKKNRPLATVGALIRAPDDTYLWVKSWKWGNRYSLPGGKVELDETLVEAVAREVKEETGLEVTNIEFLNIQECINSPEFWKPAHFIMHDYVMDLAPGFSKNDVILNDEAHVYEWLSIEEALNKNLIRQGFIVLEALKHARHHRF